MKNNIKEDRFLKPIKKGWIIKIYNYSGYYFGKVLRTETIIELQKVKKKIIEVSTEKVVVSKLDKEYQLNEIDRFLPSNKVLIQN